MLEVELLDETTSQDQTPRRLRRDPIELTFSLPQLAGGALAAATAAAIGAQLGVAGTIIGAAVASLVGGVAGTLYSAGLDRTHRKVTTAISKRRAVIVQPDVSAADETLLLPAGQDDTDPADTLIDLPAVGQPSRPRRRIGVWGTVAISTAAIFVLALVAISVVELGLGRALDGGSGTTVGQVVRPPAPSKSAPVPSPSGTLTPSPTPTVTVTQTVSPSPSASPSASEPTPTQTPSASPSDTPTAADPAATPAG